MTHDLGDRSVFVGCNAVWVISWSRAELIDLNYYKPWIRDIFSFSSCNLNEVESVFPFVSPILRSIRNNLLRNVFISRREFESFLKGSNWLALGFLINLGFNCEI